MFFPAGRWIDEAEEEPPRELLSCTNADSEAENDPEADLRSHDDPWADPIEADADPITDPTEPDTDPCTDPDKELAKF